MSASVQRPGDPFASVFGTSRGDTGATLDGYRYGTVPQTVLLRRLNDHAGAVFSGDDVVLDALRVRAHPETCAILDRAADELPGYESGARGRGDADAVRRLHNRLAADRDADLSADDELLIFDALRVRGLDRVAAFLDDEDCPLDGYGDGCSGENGGDDAADERARALAELGIDENADD